ncbi:phosphoribosylformylglycinamidine synthase [Terrimicrobium sacchariphilum]|uniref:Phosphoribosylformylglycinamidine synthase subunit PurL n=1 Tax=Terrimicrobium sacchariphilum TaxID=690879 RepID=A0A146GA03_TERSA|nr:phosphoribosylformylglycinamidine synthase subunit PurL [Terrimicrobium sacchariphilum]GAT34290.1 phosphoribosylformylglycinamidine synthase [Terrimicrobium sacchariphilum]
MNEPAITPEIIAKHGLTPDEYERIQKILGRDPNFTELGVFSVMWSEHCSYKNSKPELRKFPTTGDTVLVKAGEENAGVIDVGDGWAVAFKMESHNHPSAVEPFQGAATGVGGIIRDIFTMGARPVFNLNSLRFGDIRGDSAEARTNRRLFAGVVSGIAHYGNCIGIPTIGGEVYFDESYSGNPLVNVFCLGVLKHEEIARGAASGIGNPVFYVGAETGRDGLAGAAFASRDLTEESKQDRPAVQVGDPFREKLLLEACLELLASGCVAGIQDMGAAGLTCSTCETASRGGTGVEIDLALVPKRETGMTPYETLLSESQERMLVIVKKGQEDSVRQIFEKWDLPYAEIGTVKDDGFMRVKENGVTVVEIPARSLADEAPIYNREVSEKNLPAPFDAATLPETDVTAALVALMSHPSLASKRWVWRQYDHMVRLGATVLPGSDAAVFIVREANKILAATSDCNAIYCRLDPREGAKVAVAEAARNLACSGAVPLAVTDNLNFGNPHKPENFLMLREAVEGLAEACREFNTPVTGGNVSLYNESPNGTIDPTPTVGMVGQIADIKHVTTQAFKAAGDVILLLGQLGDEIGGSHYLKVVHGQKAGLPPRLDYATEKALHNGVREIIRKGLVQSAHDLSEGGIAVAVAESSLSAKPALGASIDLGPTGLRPDVALFNESQSRIIVSVTSDNAAEAESVLKSLGVPVQRIGTVNSTGTLQIAADGKSYSWQLSDLETAWGETIGKLME